MLTSDKPGDEKDEMRVIPIGITDGIATEVLNGALPPGTKVVTDETDTKKKKGSMLLKCPPPSSSWRASRRTT